MHYYLISHSLTAIATLLDRLQMHPHPLCDLSYLPLSISAHGANLQPKPVVPQHGTATRNSDLLLFSPSWGCSCSDNYSVERVPLRLGQLYSLADFKQDRTRCRPSRPLQLHPHTKSWPYRARIVQANLTEALTRPSAA